MSSGRWDPAAGKWLTPARTRRVEAFGFEIGGDAENYQRQVRIRGSADILRVAHTIVDVFYSAFEYRGLTPLIAMLVHESRAEQKPTLDAVTSFDVTKLFMACGFRVEEAELEDEDQPPLLRCRKRGAWTMVTFDDGIAGEDFYRRIAFSCQLPVSPARAERLRQAEGLEGQPVVEVTTVLPIGGGVTSDWIAERILEWDAMLKARQPKVVRQQQRG